MASLLKSAWQYRGFVGTSVANEFKTRLARSKFGTAWLVLHPLAQVLIFALVLTNVLAARLPGVDNRFAYAIYLLSGILCWSLFNEVVQRLVTVFIDNASLLKKIQFPRITLPLVVVGSALVSNLALLGVILLGLPAFGVYPNLNYLWLPVLMMITVALATGIGLLLGTLNVFVRDIAQATMVVLQFWFWVTPIVYPINVVPEAFKVTLALNPVMPLVMGYHNVIVFGTAPPALWGSLITAVAFLALAMVVFRKASSEMVDVL